MRKSLTGTGAARDLEYHNRSIPYDGIFISFKERSVTLRLEFTLPTCMLGPIRAIPSYSSITSIQEHLKITPASMVCRWALALTTPTRDNVDASEPLSLLRLLSACAIIQPQHQAFNVSHAQVGISHCHMLCRFPYKSFINTSAVATNGSIVPHTLLCPLYTKGCRGLEGFIISVFALRC